MIIIKKMLLIVFEFFLRLVSYCTLKVYLGYTIIVERWYSGFVSVYIYIYIHIHIGGMKA